MRCRQCGKELPLFKKLADNDFCSAEHRELFLDEQQRAMVARLAESGRRLKRRFASGRTADPPLVQPIDPNPAPRPPTGFFSQAPPPREQHIEFVEIPLEFAAPAPAAFPARAIEAEHRAIRFARTQPLPGFAERDIPAALRAISASAAASIAPLLPSTRTGASAGQALGASGRLFRMRPRSGVNRETQLWCAVAELLPVGVVSPPALHLRVIGYSIPDPIRRPLRITIAARNRETPSVLPIAASADSFSSIPGIRTFDHSLAACAPALVNRAARTAGSDGVSRQVAPWWIADLASLTSISRATAPALKGTDTSLQPRISERFFRARPRAGVGHEPALAVIASAAGEQIPQLALPVAARGLGSTAPQRTERLFRMRPRAGITASVAPFTAIDLTLASDGGRVAAMPRPLRSVIGILNEPPMLERPLHMRPRVPVGSAQLRPVRIEASAHASVVAHACPSSKLEFHPTPRMVTREYRLRPRSGVAGTFAPQVAEPSAFGPRLRTAVPELGVRAALTPRHTDRLYRMRPRTGVNSRSTTALAAPQFLAIEVHLVVPRNAIRGCAPQTASRLFRMRPRNPVSCASASLLRLVDMGAAEASEIFVMPPVPQLHVVRTFELPRSEKPTRTGPPGPTAATGESSGVAGPEPLDPALVARSIAQVRFPTITAVIGIVEPETKWQRSARITRSLLASYFNPRYWRPAPALRLSSCGAAVLTVILVYTAANSSASSGQNAAARAPVSNTVSDFRRTLAARSAVDLAESFGSGLHEWEGGRNWAASWSYDDRGGVKPGALALYKPTAGLQDYTVEFMAQIEQKGLAFVTRAADIQNYYVVKLVVTQPGPLPVVSIVRYPVLNGREAKRIQKRLVMTLYNDTIYRVRTTLRADTWTLAVNDQIVDSWTDDRLSAGGVGLFSAKGEKARIYDLRVRHQDDTIGKVLATIADTRPQATKGTPAQ